MAALAHSNCVQHLRLYNTIDVFLSSDGKQFHADGPAAEKLRGPNNSHRDRFVTAAMGLKLWNSLPVHSRQTDINFDQFKRIFIWVLRFDSY